MAKKIDRRATEQKTSVPVSSLKQSIKHAKKVFAESLPANYRRIIKTSLEEHAHPVWNMELALECLETSRTPSEFKNSAAEYHKTISHAINVLDTLRQCANAMIPVLDDLYKLAPEAGEAEAKQWEAQRQKRIAYHERQLAAAKRSR